MHEIFCEVRLYILTRTNKEFLEANRKMYDSAVAKQRWNELFRTSLKLELGLFNSAFSPLLRNLHKVSEDTIKGLLSDSEDMAF